MCGFAGLLDFRRRTPSNELSRIAHAMGCTLRHRGPDDEGLWADAEAAIALANRRLAIVDLSPAGRLPMASASGRYVIAFNGEIYNFRAFRAELAQLGAAPAWRGHSDTEVLLAAIEHWGVQAAVSRTNGMFAFALWDTRDRVLWLGRDRMGEKPLYYGLHDGVLLFASELKALRAFPAFKPEIDRGSLALLLRHDYIPAPYSIYRQVQKLLPGTLLKVPASAASLPSPLPYWTLQAAAEQGAATAFAGSDADASAQLDDLLRDAVRLRMIADVPLGAFLSGGLDSSTVVALMQAQSERPVRTFSIGYSEGEYDEREAARRVAAHLGTEHTELRVTPAQALAVVPRLPQMYDEPFADASQIPTFLVAQLARQHVTVGLSGDGGDEVFGGYNRYTWSGAIWDKMAWLPEPARRAVAAAITSVSPAAWDSVFHGMRHLLPARLRQRVPGDRLHKLAGVLPAASQDEMYFLLTSHWQQPEKVVRDAAEPSTLLNSRNGAPALESFPERMMYLDTLTYLPDDILAKLDRATMAVSLEGRVPLLDHRVVEFAWRLPLAMKVRDGQGKWLLRQVLYNYIPRELVDRPKAGFGIPLDQWLRGPLRDWAESLLSAERLSRQGFFHPAPVRRKWLEHVSGRRNWQYHLWNVLMFQTWLDAQRAAVA